MPALTATRRAQMAEQRRGRGRFDGPETLTLGERCLLAFGSSSGPPMLPVLYNNHYQIVQSKDTVMILVEMVHDARVIRIGGKHGPSHLRKWMGDSVGRWEGDTLVVETTNFNELQNFRGSTPTMKITERFRRTAPDTIQYSFTVNDPAAFAAPFTGEVPFYATDEKSTNMRATKAIRAAGFWRVVAKTIANAQRVNRCNAWAPAPSVVREPSKFENILR